MNAKKIDLVRQVQTDNTSSDQCPGCGKAFAGERGLRTHQSGRFVAMACKKKISK